MSHTISTASNGPIPQPTASTKVSSGFIIGPIADSLLIIGAPLLALFIAGPLFAVPDSLFTVQIHDQRPDLRRVFIISFTNAHLFLVFFRSHANSKIFWTHPWRFTVVPIVLILAGAFSPPILGLMGLVGIWWDVYHSSLQTFGFGRIYDSKQKNGSTVGRNLDYWMNLIVYLGPVLAGAHFIDHVRLSIDHMQFLGDYGDSMDKILLNQAPAFLTKSQIYMTVAVIAIGVPYIIYYLIAYYRLSRQGYQVSWQKVWLMIITSTISIYCWGFNSFIDAFWVMNFFHALQYFAIVIFSERQNLSKVFFVGQFRYGGLLAGIWVTSFCLLYGLWTWAFISNEWLASMTLTTSLMHFWYDGFIWSVKNKQV